MMKKEKRTVGAARKTRFELHLPSRVLNHDDETFKVKE